jgi:thiamine monophosphate synthase
VLAEVAALGTPVIAIGGVTPASAPAIRDAGAWGVAAIRALWHAADSYAAAMALLTPWSSGT